MISRASRYAELDILRGIAVILVLGRHVIRIPETLNPLVSNFFQFWREVGWVGVDLFFVLSGYLVSGLLFKEFSNTGKLRVWRFLIRRGFKIYPSYYFFIGISMLSAYHLSFPRPLTPAIILGDLVFLQNYIGSLWNHTWSLAVEEHFYFLLALLALFYRIIPSRMRKAGLLVPSLFLIIALSLLIWRIVISARLPLGAWAELFSYTHLRLDGMFFGVFLAYLQQRDSQALSDWTLRNSRYLIALVLSALVSPALFPLAESRFIYSAGFTLLYLGAGALLLLSLFYRPFSQKQIAKKLGVLRYIGENSYSIYLWHMPVYEVSAIIIPPIDSKHFYTQVPIYILGSIIVGTVIAKLVEFPMLRIRDRYFP